jgi:endonuclease/exonuclease/phosphatase (EEP) superfamily protein YafD
VEVGGKVINVLVTHVGRHEDHDPQMRAVAELFLSLAEPAMLMGDLNANPDDPQITRLRSTPGVVDAVSSSVEGKFPHHVDWIFLRGLRSARAGASDEGVSDHPFFWADVEAR